MALASTHFLTEMSTKIEGGRLGRKPEKHTAIYELIV
jgi:hypothetical protein